MSGALGIGCVAALYGFFNRAHQVQQIIRRVLVCLRAAGTPRGRGLYLHCCGTAFICLCQLLFKRKRARVLCAGAWCNCGLRLRAAGRLRLIGTQRGWPGLNGRLLGYREILRLLLGACGLRLR